MSRLKTFGAIVAALHGLVLLGSIAPASASRVLSLRRDIGDKDLLYNGENSVESITTVYYGAWDRIFDIAQLGYKQGLVRRVQASFSGVEPKEDECMVSMNSHSDQYGGYISPDHVKVESLGKDRAIVRWVELHGGGRYHLHFSIVDFSNCENERETRTELPEGKDIDKLVDKYVKGEDDFEVVMLNGTSVSRLTVDAQGVASKIDTLLTYQSDGHNEPRIFPLAKGEGYLFIEVPPHSSTEKDSMTVSHIKPDGQKQYLTAINEAYFPSVSLANGLIGICALRNVTTMKCTQFKLGDKDISWFSASLPNTELSWSERVVYNLPRGEGFLTHVRGNEGLEKSSLDSISDKYLVKIGLDGKAKQFLDAEMRCRYVSPGVQETGVLKISEDERGNYCLSTVCVKRIIDSTPDAENFKELVATAVNENKNLYVKLHSKCFEPNDFTNISK
ncbi:uncharacterized protein LOC106653548 [Trichogramma pretiosum]|uniref:uncharacterized protein LOC106653548 n=1 Tax=Trichogramma pretiosum TaxID=7493 RepID=UPI0006C94969|nr:uncharacterized protein LOC106653548 [Trichogramma pretiosum]